MGKEALVVKTDLLFKDGQPEGFISLGQTDFENIIISNHSYIARSDELENDLSLQQIIPYVWIVNPKEKKVFLYKRSFNHNKAEGEYREERYMHKYSGGIGGHIDKDTEEGSSDPIGKAMMRELVEEVYMENYPTPKVMGYLNDNGDEVGKVHFGVLAIAETEEAVKSKEEEGLSEGAFYSIEEVEEILKKDDVEFEGWSVLSWPEVKNYLQNL